MTMKSKLAKGAVAGALAIGVLGAGAGVASADPGPNQQPVPGQDQFNGPGQHDDPGNHNPGPEGRDNRQAPQPEGHGFWFFGTWIPLP